MTVDKVSNNCAQLRPRQAELITNIHSNMQPIVRMPFDQALLRHCALAATVLDELKSLC